MDSQAGPSRWPVTSSTTDAEPIAHEQEAFGTGSGSGAGISDRELRMAAADPNWRGPPVYDFTQGDGGGEDARYSAAHLGPQGSTFQPSNSNAFGYGHGYGEDTALGFEDEGYTDQTTLLASASQARTKTNHDGYIGETSGSGPSPGLGPIASNSISTTTTGGKSHSHSHSHRSDSKSNSNLNSNVNLNLSRRTSHGSRSSRASGDRERYRERDRLRGGGGGHGHGHGQGHGQVTSMSMTVEQRKALWWRNTLVTGLFVLAWYTFATLLSLYNKWMFSPEYYGFSYPLFVTSCHLILQFILAGVIRTVWAERFRPKERPTRRDYVAKIFPTALSTGGDIGLSNLSLKTITLSLYTMCKSSTLVFVLGFAFLFRLEKYSLRLVGVVLLITFGVFLMVLDTTAVSVPGIIMVFSASALAGLRWALTETVMHKQSMGLSNPFATMFWLAPISAVVLAIVSIGIEGWGTIFGSDFFVGFTAVKTTGYILFPGALAFSMVASEYFIIQRAGIIPLSIAGMFKEVSTISISALVFGDQLTPVNIGGVAIAVIGIGLYTYHKYQKSISAPLPSDTHGKGSSEFEYSTPGQHASSHPYTSLPRPASASASSFTDAEEDNDDDDDDDDMIPITPGLKQNGVQMTELDSSAPGSRSLTPPLPRTPTASDKSRSGHSSRSRTRTRTNTPKKSTKAGASSSSAGYPPTPKGENESAGERADRLLDEFEGWGERDWSDRASDDDEEDDDADDDDEVDDDEVHKRMGERRGGKGSWGKWWDKSM